MCQEKDVQVQVNSKTIFVCVYLKYIDPIIFSRIVAISLIAIHRMRLIAMKHIQPRIDLTQSQLDLTHYNLPKKMPWIKC